MAEKRKFGKLTLFEKVIYGTGDVGLNVMYTLFSTYVMYFYTDVILVNAALIGTVILISRIFDGVSDLIAGRYIDTHKGKWGHCMSILVKWSIPMAVSVLLVFLVPNSSLPLKIAYIFVTYNLFNTVMYTLVGLAHTALPTYVTDDPVGKSQMMVFKMLFAAITQTIMANAILPMVEFFGGQAQQSAWVKSVAVFAVIGLVFMLLNVLFVHERVEVPANNEKFLESLKYAVQNKYWLIGVLLAISINMILYINLATSIYYFGAVEGNPILIGSFISAFNLPGIVVMLIMPAILAKVSKRTMVVVGTALMIIGQLIFAFTPVGNTTLMLISTAIRGIGFSFPMGLASAFIADTVDYGEWKTGTRVQTMLFSASSVGGKIASGLLTSLFGIFIDAIGYVGGAEVQVESAVNGINIYFRWLPFVFYALILLCCFLFDLEKKLPKIREELVERRGALE